MVISMPRVIATAWVSLEGQWSILTDRWGDGDLVAVMARFLAIIALAFPIPGMGYLLWRLVRSTARSVWSKTSGKPLQRAVAMVTAAALVAMLGFAWWPRGDTYRPIAAYERGTLSDVVSFGSTSEDPGQLYAGMQSQLQTVWPEGATRPTRDKPGLAMVMVPRAAESQPSDLHRHVSHADHYPYALASCTNCAAVAVSFEVVLVLGDADVVVPQNLAGSLTYNCIHPGVTSTPTTTTSTTTTSESTTSTTGGTTTEPTTDASPTETTSTAAAAPSS